MGEKCFVWDESSDQLTLLGVSKTEDEHVKPRGKYSDPIQTPQIYCPHAYLILNFHETLSQGEQIKFRKHYLRKVSPNEPDVVILQDIKNLVLFLLATPVSPPFINFFHLPIVDRFLRALIIYFQYYVKVWEELMQERAATMKKAPNPLARGHRSQYKNDIQCLRCMLGREYADLIVGCQDIIQYHHMMSDREGASTITQSKGEGDLRIFEVLICMAHRVVWIALQRKHFNIIEIELQRLLRTDSHNMAERRNPHIIQDMLKDDIYVLHGRKVQPKTKLLQNSPLIEEIVHSECDYRLLCLGSNNLTDPRIIYLQNALLVEEEKLSQLGIKVGILGQNRANFSVMLTPLEEEKSVELDESEKYDGRKVSVVASHVTPKKDEGSKSLPPFQSDVCAVPGEIFPVKLMKQASNRYQNAHEEARRKWIAREVKRRRKKQLYMFITTID